MKSKHQQMYMRIAEAVAETSSSKRLKVGAVAVKNNQVIGTGYNALPAGLDGDMEDKVYFTGGGWIELILAEYDTVCDITEEEQKSIIVWLNENA